MCSECKLYFQQFMSTTVYDLNIKTNKQYLDSVTIVMKNNNYITAQIIQSIYKINIKTLIKIKNEYRTSSLYNHSTGGNGDKTCPIGR